jgi:tetratricopeptide (TPR) repeat protein
MRTGKLLLALALIGGTGPAAPAESGDPHSRARARTAEASQAIERLDYGRAATLLKEAESAAFPDGPADLRAAILAGKGRVLWALGQFQASRAAYLEQAETLRRSGDLFGEARARYSVAILAGRLRTLGEMDRADVVREATEAIDAAVRAGNPGAEARARLLLGQLLYGAEGIEQFEKALEISRKLGDRQSARFARRLLAWYVTDADPGRRAEAERWLDQVIEEAKGDGDLQDTARGLIVRSWLVWKGGERERWIDAHVRAIEAVERVRDLQSDELVRARVFSQWALVYYRFAGRLLDGLAASPDVSGDLDLAFTTIERMRARVLLDVMDAAGARVAGARVAGTPPVSLQEIRDRLAPDQALLSFHYSVGMLFPDPRIYEGGAWAILVTREGASAFPISKVQDLPDQVAVLLGLYRRRDDSGALVGADLYRDLLEIPLGRLGRGVKRLVIVPDGCLSRLPFAALPGEDGRPLAERFSIELAPSATLWSRWKEKTGAEPAEPSVLALADPAIASGSGGSAPAGGPPERRTTDPLPRARDEAARMAAALPGASVVLVGAGATEAALKKADLKRFGVVHLAAHAVLDDERPERSAVLLAPGDGEDGLLQVKEIVGLPLRGQAVILTACRSASGAWIDGEGVMGLARAFFEAGARAVVGSLWPLRDDETAALMRDFSAALGSGCSVADALASAQRKAIASGAPVAAWAGLVTLGNGDLLPSPSGGPGPAAPRPWPWPAGPLALAAAILALAVGLHREGR